jgi:hypothetical protein
MDNAEEQLRKDETDLLMREYDHLREEVRMRIGLAFSNVAYAGALVMFALPASSVTSPSLGPRFFILLALIGALILIQIALVNWAWAKNCVTHTRQIECRVNAIYGKPILRWETRLQNEGVAATWPVLTPKLIADCPPCRETSCPHCRHNNCCPGEPRV